MFLLQAWMPIQSNFSSKTASSRCSTPSSFVPGGGAIGHAWLLRRCGGVGAKRIPRLDDVSKKLFWGLGENDKGVAVILISFEVLPIF
jgi:hypothetical protein